MARPDSGCLGSREASAVVAHLKVHTVCAGARRHHLHRHPVGVILGMFKDKQVWLKPGDRIESLIEKLGTLKFQLA
jgi:2-keto-4-pentenoate hydratase/2-oxohepta-3-ene-1,7-dioic acid hydratase in catechol pathway